MARYHATPLLLGETAADAQPLVPLSLTGTGDEKISEAYIQELVHLYPSVLPIADIDTEFLNVVAICTELNTRGAGSIDNFLVTPSGLPVLVECKLWRNPEGRRKVVGQILDYARALSQFSCSDIQREVSARLGGGEGALFERVLARAPDTDEIEFNDSLTRNLRAGRFLLLIVGDGVREGVSAIGEVLRGYAGLPFTLGLVELPIFVALDGSRLVTPRVVARTTLIEHRVVTVPEGMTLQAAGAGEAESDPALDEMTQDRIRFWTEFLSQLQLNDPEQPLPKPGRQGYVAFMLPAPAGSVWITVFRNVNEGRVGLFLSYTRNTVGERAVRRIVDEQWDDISLELGGTVRLLVDKMERLLIHDEVVVGPLALSANREQALRWLRTRSNDFVNALRPRVRTAAAAIAEEG